MNKMAEEIFWQGFEDGIEKRAVSHEYALNKILNYIKKTPVGARLKGKNTIIDLRSGMGIRNAQNLAREYLNLPIRKQKQIENILTEHGRRIMQGKAQLPGKMKMSPIERQILHQQTIDRINKYVPYVKGHLKGIASMPGSVGEVGTRASRILEDILK